MLRPMTKRAALCECACECIEDRLVAFGGGELDGVVPVEVVHRDGELRGRFARDRRHAAKPSAAMLKPKDLVKVLRFIVLLTRCSAKFKISMLLNHGILMLTLNLPS